jgi:hypothetical protein
MSLPARLPVLAALLALAALPARGATPQEEVHALRQEIAALQVDRALNLTPAKARELLPILEEGAARAREARAAREAAAPSLVAALARARDDLRATGSVSDATRQAIAAARGPAASLRPEFEALRARVRAVLSPEQLQALKTAPLWIGRGPGAGAAVATPGTRGRRARRRRRRWWPRWRGPGTSCAPPAR